MFCPNCGAINNKRQNYCRLCGLNLQDSAKSLANQIVFGEDSALLKRLSSVKRILEFASTALIGLMIGSVIVFIFRDQNIGKDMAKIGVGTFLLLKIVEEIIGYFQRTERSKPRDDRFRQNTSDQFESKETVRLLEEKQFEPAPNRAEHSTKLLPEDNKVPGLNQRQ